MRHLLPFLFLATIGLLGCSNDDEHKVGSTVIVPATANVPPLATLTTFGSAATTIYTEDPEATQSVYDYVGTVVGVNTGADGGSYGDMYRADFAFSEQRTDAGPVVAGAVPVALNVRTTGSGGSFGGITFTTSGNSVVFQVAGSTGNQVDWTFNVSRMQVH